MESGGILAGLRARGHLVANHTYDHPSLPAFVARGGDAADQLARTDAAIRDHVEGPVTFVRPPYGDWRLEGQTQSCVAASLNRSSLASRYVGPIGWDIDAGDVGFWGDGRSAAECAQAYLDAIEQAGRGIVLMHDSTADIPEIRPRNQALGMARILVPQLRKRGYRFLRLDTVPQIASAAQVSEFWTLTALDGSYLIPGSMPGEMRFAREIENLTMAVLGGVKRGPKRWALRTANGLFLSPRPDGDVLADAVSPGDRETLIAVPRGRARFALRTIDGLYLCRKPSDPDRLHSSAAPLEDSEIFTLAIISSQ